MSLLSWFKSKKKDDDVYVVNIKEESVPLGQMASASPSCAAEQISRMMDQKKSPIKILVIGNGVYSNALTEYALKMAQRLDCKIIALDVSEAPLRYTGERREQEIAKFLANSEERIIPFAKKAESMHISFKHITEVEEEEKAIAQLSRNDASIRYVLTEPEEGLYADDQNKVMIPVFDLACSRL